MAGPSFSFLIVNFMIRFPLHSQANPDPWTASVRPQCLERRPALHVCLPSASIPIPQRLNVTEDMVFKV
jgi:hypothetical protein